MHLKQRFTYSVLSAFLALLILFGGTAREFVHQFTGHEDTVHCNAKKDGLSFETQHHHCSFLGDSLAPFCADAEFPYIPALLTTYTTPKDHFAFFLLAKERLFTALRGPPAIS